MVVQDSGKAADAAACKRLDGARGQGIHADAHGSEVRREVTDGRLQRGLGHAHDVVVLHHPLAAQITECDDAAALFHERLGGMGQGRQGVGADVLGDVEILAAGGDEITFEGIAWRVGHRVNEEIKFAPPLGQLLESRLDLGIVRHIQGQQQGRVLQLLGQFRHILAEALVLIAEGKVGAIFRAFLGDGPRDGPLVGHAHDQAAHTFHQHRINSSRIYWNEGPTLP